MAGIAERLRRRIASDGPISFADFMDAALYGEGGYYARAASPIGEDGDYVTGSSLSPLFGRATAALLRALDGLLGRPVDLLEAGCGWGVHLRAVAESLKAAPRESTANRRLLGWDRVARPLPPGVELLESLGEIAAGEIDGLVFSYELFDALPVHRLVRRPSGLRELRVGLSDDGAFEWREGELSSPELATLPGVDLVDGQIADLSPGWRPLYRELAAKLGRGLLVTCDYGFETRRLLDPRVRRHGTLACYRRQRVHRDPFVDLGEQDLTAHVDFSALIEEGERAGLETRAFTRQAPWLAACGLLEGLDRAAPRQRVETQQLLQLDGMGEEIRVLVQSRALDWPALVETLPGLAYL